MSRIAVIPGDGIGPEVIRAAVDVLEHLASRKPGLELDLEWHDYGADRYLRDGVGFPDAEREEIAERCDAILLGAVGDPRVPDSAHAREIVLETRFALDLYVNLRPCQLLDSRYCPLAGKGPKEVDFVVFRENTEGIYIGVGGFLKKGTPDEVATQTCLNTRKGVERILRAAYEFADARKLSRVCMSDKSNALRFTGDLWQRAWQDVRKDFPHIESRHLYIDVLAMELVRHPEDFDVIVTGNLFGDIVTDLGAALQGGLGMASSANMNPDRGIGMFEPVHGSAPDIVGTGRANPLASVLTTALMLEHLGHQEHAELLQQAARNTLLEGQTTPDLGGSLDTQGVRDALLVQVDALTAD